MKRVHFLTIVAILGLLVLGTAQPAHAAALPDLTILRIKPLLLNRFECVVSVIAGRSIPFLQYDVSNAGSVSSGTFTITIEDSAGAIKQAFTTPSLSPGSTRRFWHAMESCNYYRKVILDSTNIVLESSEDNNTFLYGFDSLPSGLG